MVQALFANQRETNLQSTIALIDEVLGELGHDPESVSRRRQTWRFARARR